MPAAAKIEKPLEAPRFFIPFAAVPGLSLEGLKASPIVPGVSVCTEGAADGHYAWDANDIPHPEVIDSTTLDTIITAAAAFANGVRVNNGHYSPVNEACGYLSAFTKDGVKLRANLTLFRSYNGFEHLAEIIATVPDTFGLSLDFDRTHEFRDDGKAYVRATQIISCDLVSAPAANRGLFDKPRTAKPMADPITPATVAPATPTPAPAAPAAAPDTAAITAAVQAALAPIQTQLGELTTKVNSLAAKVEAAPAATPAPTDPPATPAPAAGMEALRAELTAMQRKLDVAFSAQPGATPAAAPADGQPPAKQTAYERNLAAVAKLNAK